MQGMKNKEIALRVGTNEQVVKNYLRKVYDKLGVADRLELALYCLNNRVLQDAKVAAPADQSKLSPEKTPEPVKDKPESSNNPELPETPKKPSSSISSFPLVFLP